MRNEVILKRNVKFWVMELSTVKEKALIGLP